MATPLRTVIGVDAGGTGTRAVLLDHTGRALSLARTGPGNPTSAGLDLAVTNIVAACTGAFTAAPEPVAQPDVIALCMAGVIAAGGRVPEVEAALVEAGFGATVAFKGDVLAAYFSATADPDGAVVIVGTGATGARIRDGEFEAMSDGLGWLIGDEGSGFWIGQQVVRAVCAALDGRGPDTALVDALMGLIDIEPQLSQPWRDERLMRILTWAYARRPVELSVAARLVTEVGDDPVAAGIVAEAAARVVTNVGSVTGADTDGPIVLGGSVVAPGSPVGRLVAAELGERVRHARDGIAGAALVALRELGVRADAEVLARISTGLAALP
ncbi:N-acetylglucosamine kinase [Propionibacteriaceae bacterium Y1923]|uniref:N-acetylglucosamine kinase n=1 Tax=Aestuariimicrobium sp. Y1814 TaxID=3418742 RepID=UPI003C1438BE